MRGKGLLESRELNDEKGTQVALECLRKVSPRVLLPNLSVAAKCAIQQSSTN